MKYLNKYSKLWNEMNCSTINVIDTTNFVSQLYFDDRKAEVSEFMIKKLIKGRFLHAKSTLENLCYLTPPND